MEIEYTTMLKDRYDIYLLYKCLEWNEFLKLSKEQLLNAMEQSHYVIYAYDGDKLIGTGRIVSDGVINAYLCGLGVETGYRGKGIGTEIIRRLEEYCRNNGLHMQFFCKEELVPYYKKMGFEIFSVGMKAKEN